jgi:hypothetical protein
VIGAFGYLERQSIGKLKLLEWAIAESVSGGVGRGLHSKPQEIL